MSFNTGQIIAMISPLVLGLIVFLILLKTIGKKDEQLDYQDEPARSYPQPVQQQPVQPQQQAYQNFQPPVNNDERKQV